MFAKQMGGKTLWFDPNFFRMFNIKNVLANRSIKHKFLEFKWQFVTLPKYAWQRATKGYTTSDLIIFGFDDTHARYIGHSLIALADVMHGAPGGYSDKNMSLYEDTDFKAWENDLRKHGQALILAGEDDSDESLQLLINDRDKYLALEKERRENVSAAFHWIADWHSSLWD